MPVSKWCCGFLWVKIVRIRPGGRQQAGKKSPGRWVPLPLPTEKSCWGRGSQKGVCKIQSANDLEVKIQKSKKLGPWVAGFVYTAFALTMMS